MIGYRAAGKSTLGILTQGGPATTMVANCILAHKLARATYHVIQGETPFRMEKLF